MNRDLIKTEQPFLAMPTFRTTMEQTVCCGDEIIMIPATPQTKLMSADVVRFVAKAKNWPQPMQDDLLPLLMANGFRTQAEQDDNRTRALLRAAALDPHMSGRQRTDYAKEFGRPSAIRAVWWVRRTFGRDEWDG